MKIYAVELTSECNIQCTYCPQPDMNRAKEHMPLSVFEKVLDYPMALNGVAGHLFGEAFLHPDLLEMTKMCKEKGLDFGFSTNTLLLDLNIMEQLIDAGLTWIVISYHVPKAGQIETMVKQAFPDLPVYNNILEAKHDWAGQVDYSTKNNVRQNVQQAQAVEGDCIFHEYDFATVSAQGELYACCIDAEGVSSFGSLFEYSPEAIRELYNTFELISSDVSAYKSKVSLGQDRRMIASSKLSLPFQRNLDQTTET